MWVDLFVENILKRSPGPHVINDAKTPSGHVTVAHLRGVLTHECIARGLHDRGAGTTFLYGFDDYDPMDDLPPSLPDYARYMGMPLAEIPAPPEGAEAPNYGRYFADEFERVFTRLGARPRVYRTSEMYRAGGFDRGIRLGLDRVAEIREIWREVTSSKRIDEGWWPVQVLCENCGRIGTTNILAWDGTEVEYVCAPDKVVWARGCGHRGRRSPFGGGAKLLYRMEWPAKWDALGVTVEGAGKDHMTRGGSHDVAVAISERIFDRPAPFSFAYEFLLYGGKKMSTSKAVGATAAEILEVLREELARFLIVRPHPRKQVEFDPYGDTIPNLYDEYDRAAAAYFGDLSSGAARTPAVEDLARTFYFSRVGGEQRRCYRPRFSKVVQLMQIPSVDIVEAMERDKGAPLAEADRAELARRIEDARRWLATYAPDAAKFEIRPVLPEGAARLSPAQRQYLARIADAMAGRRWTGEELHADLHALKQELGLGPREAFGAIYQALLGKDSGPQAGWLLAALDPGFVQTRLREAARDAA
ncbi:MAG TPA: lysine--tRNA ligase [bacterium]|nr:lysine--tRNA ligase [bacterium]